MPKAWEVQGLVPLARSLYPGASNWKSQERQTTLTCLLSPHASELWESCSWFGTLREHMGFCFSLCDV